jgi:hypothetical protein
MTGCLWPDNQKSQIIEDDPKRPVNAPVLYVKIIWQITSYSTLFILKRNTGNCFYFCRTYVSQESFLKKSVTKRCLEPRAFVYSLAHFPFSFRLSIYERLSAHNCRYTNGCPLTTPPAHWKWRRTAYRWEARLIEAWITEVLLYIYTCSWHITLFRAQSEDGSIRGAETCCCYKWINNF